MLLTFSHSLNLLFLEMVFIKIIQAGFRAVLYSLSEYLYMQIILAPKKAKKKKDKSLETKNYKKNAKQPAKQKFHKNKYTIRPQPQRNETRLYFINEIGNKR